MFALLLDHPLKLLSPSLTIVSVKMNSVMLNVGLTHLGRSLIQIEGDCQVKGGEIGIIHGIDCQ